MFFLWILGYTLSFFPARFYPRFNNCQPCLYVLLTMTKSAVNCCSDDLHTLLTSIFHGLPGVLAGFTKCFERAEHVSSSSCSSAAKQSCTPRCAHLRTWALQHLPSGLWLSMIPGLLWGPHTRPVFVCSWIYALTSDSLEVYVNNSNVSSVTLSIL